MHELSIAMEIVRQAAEIAGQHRAERIEEIEVEVGVLRQIQEDALRMGFEAAAQGTPAEGARLLVTEVKLAADCRSCGRPFAPQPDNFVCPRCGVADAKIVAGNDIILKSLVCQTHEEAAL